MLNFYLNNFKFIVLCLNFDFWYLSYFSLHVHFCIHLHVVIVVVCLLDV